MQTRRKFLGRSALGAGSILLSATLLQSCIKDHNIPPVNPPDRPPLGDADIDWNDDAKTVVVAGIGMIPEVGEILGPLVDIFWPASKVDVWGQIKAQVEALVDQKIAAQVYIDVSNDLEGLNNVIVQYLHELKTGSPSTILSYWIGAKLQFVDSLPHFKSSGNELPLLPLYGQFANMYLALLRDGALYGKIWGMSDADVQGLIDEIDAKIGEFYGWAADTYNTGRLNLAKKTKTDYHACEPFRTINKYDRQMTLTVLDFMNTWPFFSVSQFPTGTTVKLTREIYSDPMGTCDDSGPIVLASAPTQFPTQISTWSGDRVQSVQVTYPAGSGPGGVSQTKRMGASGGTNSIYNYQPNPIVFARATYGDIVNSIQFTFADGSMTPFIGGTTGSNNTIWAFDSQILSSVHINGASSFYNSADCVVFGFMYWQSPAATLRAIRALYVKSPKERSLADFTKIANNFSIPANVITDELKMARNAYWKSIKDRADALK